MCGTVRSEVQKQLYCVELFLNEIIVCLCPLLNIQVR